MIAPSLASSMQHSEHALVDSFSGKSSARSKIHSTILYYGILLQIYIAPLPLASNRDIFWLIWSLLNGVLLVFWSYAFVTKKIKSPISLLQVWFFLIASSVLIIWPLVQINYSRNIPHELWYFLSATINSEPLLQKISVDSNSTIMGLLRYGCYISVFWITLQICAVRTSYAQKLLKHIFYSALLYAIYSVIAFAVSSDNFFLYPNSRYNPYISGTYVNRNHYATHTGFAIILGFALFFEALRKILYGDRAAGYLKADLVRQIVSKTGFYIAAIITLMSALLLTFSRAGLMSTAAGLLVFFILIMCVRYFRKIRKYLLGINIFLIMLLAFAINVGGSRTFERMIQMDSDLFSRAQIYETTIQALNEEYRLTGSGLGTFEDVYQGYITADSAKNVLIDHAHNTYLENFLELGVPAYSIFLACVLYLVTYAFYVLFTKNNRQVYAVMFIAYFVQIGLHAFVDFSLEMPAFVTTVCVATDCCNKRVSSKKKTRGIVVSFFYKIRFYCGAVFFLGFGCLLTTASYLYLIHEFDHMTLSKKLDSYYQSNGQVDINEFQAFINDLQVNPEIPPDPVFLQKMAYYTMNLAYSYPSGSGEAIEAKNNAIELQKKAIKAAPLKSYLWLDLAFFYRAAEYPPRTVVAALQADYKIAPFSPYYTINKMKFYLDYWEHIPTDMKNHMQQQITKHLQTRMYEVIPALAEIKYARKVQSLYPEHSEIWKQIDGNIGYYKRIGKLR